MGATLCQEHGRQTGGPLCCPHIRVQVEAKSALSDYKAGAADLASDGISEPIVICCECVDAYTILDISSITEDVMSDLSVAPVCTKCWGRASGTKDNAS